MCRAAWPVRNCLSLAASGMGSSVHHLRLANHSPSSQILESCKGPLR